MCWTIGGPAVLFGQACSCGGAPLLGSLDTPTTGAGGWQFGLTYEYHAIRDVVAGSTRLDDDTRQRTVHSGLLEIGYGISPRFSASAILSLQQQERHSGSGEGLGERLRTRGVGDGIFLLKYNLYPFSPLSLRQLAIGAGVKVPFGKNGLTTRGLLIAADMQPGTGSWDGVFWFYAAQGFYRYLPLSAQVTMTYRVNGENDRFGDNTRGYRFGNELVTTFSFNAHPLEPVDLTLGLRYRVVGAARFAGLELPNTRGQWFNLVPGANFKLSDSFTARATTQIPVYRKLDGTQLTTSYVLAFSLYYTLDRAQKTIDW